MIKVDTGGLFSFLDKAVDQIFDTPEEKANAKAKLMNAASSGRINELNASLSVMLAEAQSGDKWTSRARPAFLYVIYIYILAAIPMGCVYAADPVLAADITAGVGDWLSAIPEAYLTLFGVGYLGYAGARTVDKWRGAK
jgi:hypothetical protein